MTKGIVTCNLIRRIGRPSVNAERNGYFVSGDEVEIKEVLLGETENDYYEGAPTWYKLTNGTFIWSGGVSLNLKDSVFKRKIFLDAKVRNQRENEFLIKPGSDFSKVITLNDEIIFNNGIGISIAVLDSGIDTRHFQKNASIVYSNDEREDKTKFPHGTKVTGILAFDSEYLKGLCTKSKILDFRTTYDESNVNDSAVIESLVHIKNNLSHSPCDIINMSLDTDFTKVSNVIKELHSKGVIIVVAAGNGDEAESSLSSLREFTITVGTFFQHNFENHIDNGFNKKHKIWFSNHTITTTGTYPDNSASFKDCSAYAAITSGLISNYLSSVPIALNERFEMVNDFLSRISHEITSESKLNSTLLKPFKNEKN